MKRIIFLVEGPSDKVFLEELLPRIIPGRSWTIIEHDGKKDLQKSVPKKLRAWRDPNVCFVILHDQDRNDCRELKTKLKKLCAEGKRSDSLVRIACRELEAWILGDLKALAQAFNRPKLAGPANTKILRNPDNVEKPIKELRKHIKSYNKISGARAVAKCLNLDDNLSHSFKVFVDGVKKYVS